MARHHGAFGDDTFGRRAEKLARLFGTPQYIVAQSLVVAAWIALNSIALISEWDPYPFILLNLAFSTQAAYAAPLILLAQTRQAERDKEHSELIDKRHTTLEEAAERQTREIMALLESNTELTREVHALLVQRSAL